MESQSSRVARLLNLLSSCSLIGLIFLCIAWELWLAPLRPGGSLLVMKTLPLLAPLFGILHGKRYTHQWASMLSLLYITEGVVRATTETGVASTLAILELMLATAFFIGTVGYARFTRPSLLAKAAGSDGPGPDRDGSAH